MPLSCFSSTGRLHFDATESTAFHAVPVAAAEFCAPDETIDALPAPPLAARCRRYAPDALVLAGLIGLLLAGTFLR